MSVDNKRILRNFLLLIGASVTIIVFLLYHRLSIHEESYCLRGKAKSNVMHVHVLADKVLYGTFSEVPDPSGRLKLYTVPISNKELDQEEEKEIYTSPALYGKIQVRNFKDSILVLGYWLEEDGGHFCIERVESDGKVQKLMEEPCKGFPSIGIAEESFFVWYLKGEGEKGYSKLLQIIPEKNKKVSLFEGIYERTPGGRWSGDIVVAAGGTDEKVYYEIVQPQKEELNSCRKFKIFTQYLRSSSPPEELALQEGSYPLLYLTGSPSYAIGSEYCYEKPLIHSGKVHTIQGKELKNRATLLEVYSGNDIRDATILDEENFLLAMVHGVGFYNATKNQWKPAFSKIKAKDDMEQILQYQYLLQGKKALLLEKKGEDVWIHMASKRGF